MILKMEDNIIVTKIRKIKRILCSLHFLPPRWWGRLRSRQVYGFRYAQPKHTKHLHVRLSQHAITSLYSVCSLPAAVCLLVPFTVFLTVFQTNQQEMRIRHVAHFYWLTLFFTSFRVENNKNWLPNKRQPNSFNFKYVTLQVCNYCPNTLLRKSLYFITFLLKICKSLFLQRTNSQKKKKNVKKWTPKMGKLVFDLVKGRKKITFSSHLVCNKPEEDIPPWRRLKKCL